MTDVTRENFLRRVWFQPYCGKDAPRFRLTTWDTGRTGYGGNYLVGYRLSIIKPGTILTLFEGEDFGCSPLHCIDSDETVAGIMGFLTLRPGDTDAEYFEDYTPEQLAYCSEHAEALGCEVSFMFPDM